MLLLHLQMKESAQDGRHTTLVTNEFGNIVSVRIAADADLQRLELPQSH